LATFTTANVSYRNFVFARYMLFTTFPRLTVISGTDVSLVSIPPDGPAPKACSHRDPPYDDGKARRW